MDRVGRVDRVDRVDRATKPPFTIMGSLDGIEAGLRQMRRTRPLETTVVDLGGGLTVGARSDAAAAILAAIDEYYDDRSDASGSVLTSLALALADPAPRDTTVIAELVRYKNLDERWHDWNGVVRVCRDLALEISGAT